MPAQKGSAFLLKISDGGSPAAYDTVAGLRTTQMTVTGETVVVTNKGSGGWRELLAGAGVRQASVSGAGVFLSDEAGEAVRALFFAGEARNWRILIPGLGQIEGPFVIANLDYSGAHDGEAQMSLALDSAGALSFTGVA